ncbi:hypothetical protein GTP58_13275 [Duganella sp. CY15W]|uniref:DUF5677 domain-containing protein n=1 Tax=Duganella sp. CY15W TaxID=2692172 RepID=UPI00136B1CB1|nr:DUF5677 domain-containing protein [Duganella sp. CY15W]MYM29295.1 hypothetical protein [Duganella sp. CY15W]
MSDTDSIKRRGFLSHEIENYSKEYRERYKNVFSICEAKSDAATQILFKTDMSVFNSTESLPVVASIALWMRCISSCQAALILIEKGMIPEAQTLIRTAYEFLFYSVAGLGNPEVFESLKEGDKHARKIQAECMKANGKHELSEEQIKELEDLAKENLGGKRAIDAFQAARMAGLTYLYSTVYRGMSFISSHPTLASTNAFFEERGDGFGLTFGPSEKGLEFSVGLIDTCLQHGSTIFDPLLAA